jgi:hypothetical protein
MLTEPRKPVSCTSFSYSHVGVASRYCYNSAGLPFPVRLRPWAILRLKHPAGTYANLFQESKDANSTGELIPALAGTPTCTPTTTQ